MVHVSHLKYLKSCNSYGFDFLHYLTNNACVFSINLASIPQNGLENSSFFLRKTESHYKKNKLVFKFLTLNPVGHQSTNWMLLLVLMVAIAAFTSFGTTSPRKRRQTA